MPSSVPNIEIFSKFVFEDGEANFRIPLKNFDLNLPKFSTQSKFLQFRGWSQVQSMTSVTEAERSGDSKIHTFTFTIVKINTNIKFSDWQCVKMSN